MTAPNETAPLVLKRSELPDRTVVYCTGKVISTTAELLKSEVKPLIVRGTAVVLDLSDVVFMDSMGLGTVAGLWASSKHARSSFTVVNLSARVRDLFTVTHLLSLFEPCGEVNARTL
jgi:anti-sigma B factor antagonist